jgi:hypothetical protein
MVNVPAVAVGISLTAQVMVSETIASELPVAAVEVTVLPVFVNVKVLVAIPVTMCVPLTVASTPVTLTVCPTV